MKSYVVLLRGINVGGKNKVSMALLKDCLQRLGFTNIETYIASGNVILDSDKSIKNIKSEIEATLIKSFKLDSELIKVLVLSRDQLEKIIKDKPKGFGELPDKYHSDAIFLIDINSEDAMKVFSPREGVDEISQGEGVIYSQRLSELRTKSRLGKIVGTPAYKSMTIRSWRTVERLLAIMQARQSK